MLKDHLHNRPNLRTAGGMVANPWLVSRRLPRDRARQHGINVLGARNSALRNLVVETPPPVLGDLWAKAAHTGTHRGLLNHGRDTSLSCERTLFMLVSIPVPNHGARPRSRLEAPNSIPHPSPACQLRRDTVQSNMQSNRAKSLNSLSRCATGPSRYRDRHGRLRFRLVGPFPYYGLSNLLQAPGPDDLAQQSGRTRPYGWTRLWMSAR